MAFEFDHKTRQKLGYQLIDIINDYYSSLSDRNVQVPLAQRSFDGLPGPLPERSENPDKILEEICQELISRGFHVPSANYFGLMNPTPTYAAVLAEALVAALNPQLASHARSQLASRIENQTLRWTGERVGWNKPFAGTFTSGGNEANFSALAMALAWKFPGVIEDGLASLSAKPVAYASAEAHHSLDKSAGLLGLGRKALRRIPVTENAQIDLDQLARQIDADREAGFAPFCVIATAGTTNSGAIDDLQGIAGICGARELWMHVDGAYGAAVIFSDKHRSLLRGIEAADSLTLDPHKWLAMPFAAGMVFTTRPEMLEKSFGVVTPYMPKGGQSTPVDNFKLGVQWSRRMNSLKLWLTLRMHGRQAYEELIDRQQKLSDDFARRVAQSSDLEVAFPHPLPILNLRLKLRNISEEEMTAIQTALVEEITRSGRHWVSSTRVNGKSVIRLMTISYLTEERHLDELYVTLQRTTAMILEKHANIAAKG